MDSVDVRALMARVRRIDAERQRGSIRDKRELEAAIGTVKDVAMQLAQLPVSANLIGYRAICHHVAFELHMAAGDQDSALEAMESADGLYAESGMLDRRAMFLHDVTVSLYEASFPSRVVAYIGGIARAAMESAGTPDSELRNFERYLDLASSVAAADDPVNLKHLRRKLKRARRGKRAVAANELAMSLMMMRDEIRSSEALRRELHDALQIAFDELIRDSSQLDAASNTLGAFIDLHLDNVDWPGWVSTRARILLRNAELMGRGDVAAIGHTLLGVDLLRQDSIALALEELLLGVARNDEHMLATESSTIRLISAQQTDYAREFALEASVMLGDFAMTAELIESARMQVVPSRSDGGGQLYAVGWRGRSRLAPSYRSPTQGVLDLEKWVCLVGGVEAVWYGTWASNQRMFWVAYISGRLDGGIVDLADGTMANEVLESALSALPHKSTKSAELLRGGMSRNPVSYHLLVLDLGNLLLPQILRSYLLERGSRENPVSLVVSGNIVGVISPSLLAIASSVADVGYSLVELATVRVAPPAVILRNHALFEGGGEFPVLISCADPNNNLDHSDSSFESQVRLTGRDTGNLRASRENVLAALENVEPGGQGIFYYAGHTSGGHGDQEDALALSDGTFISAEDVFSEGFVREHGFPARVVLSACSSSGAAGSGAGEWFGLTAGILNAGARQVLCTNWPIWDTEFTAWLDDRLVRGITTGLDPAECLRGLQLTSLDAWRASDHDYSEVLPVYLGNVPYPLIWGAFICVGVASRTDHGST